jgi:class 3 adenylate cyclase
MPASGITFLFTDIEGSTRLWEQHADGMPAALARHDALLRGRLEANGGEVFKTAGDAFCVAFARPTDAVRAALESQCVLHAQVWGSTGPLRVRMALHIGPAVRRDHDYFGPTLNRVARLLDAGHGGQTLLSHALCQVVRDSLPDGVTLRDLDRHQLKDLPHPERIYQLLHPRLPAEFPPLRSVAAFSGNLPPQAVGFIGQEREFADRRGIAVFLEGLAREAGVWGDAERATRLFAAAAALREELGTPRPPAERADYEAHVAATGEQLGPEAFAAAWLAGSTMTAEEAVAYALEPWRDG